MKYQILHNPEDIIPWFVINEEGYELSAYHTEAEARAFIEGLLWGE